MSDETDSTTPTPESPEGISTTPTLYLACDATRLAWSLLLAVECDDAEHLQDILMAWSIPPGPQLLLGALLGIASETVKVLVPLLPHPEDEHPISVRRWLSERTKQLGGHLN